MSQDRELPEGWVIATLDDVTVRKVEQGAPAEDGVFTYIDISGVDNKAKSIAEPKMLAGKEAPSRAKQHLRPGDVLVSMTRPNLNAVAVVPPEHAGAIASTGFAVLRPIAVEPNWLFYLVRSPEFIAAMSKRVQGALYPAVRAEDVRGYSIPIPPLAEQHRIVARVEELQARTRRAREVLEEVPALLERFRQSVLASAFRGDLTADWRANNPDVEPASVLLERIRGERRRHWEEAELAKLRAKGREPKDDRWKQKYQEPEPVDTEGLPELPEGWGWVTFDQLAWSVRSGTAHTSFRRETALPVLKSSAVRPGAIDFGDHNYLPEDGCSPDDLIRDGDLLITRLSGSIEYVGNCALVVNLAETRIAYPDRLFRARVIESCCPAFIELAFAAKSIRKELEEAAKSSAGHQRISLSDLRKFTIPLPPIAEQQVIAARVGRMSQLSVGISEQIAEAHSEASFLDQSILARAFRGELVPQDPNDEPASLLLERIRAERAREKKPRPGRKPQRARG